MKVAGIGQSKYQIKAFSCIVLEIKALLFFITKSISLRAAL